MDSPERAVIHFETVGVTHAVTMIYEYGGWYKEPDEFCRPIRQEWQRPHRGRSGPRPLLKPVGNASPTTPTHQTASVLAGVAAPPAVVAVAH